ncbi:GNAT family N-acetyltransferase [Paenibacillus sp. DMB20]|uniref:GNAT family N-acetyltransferase n=1 Tax=Paenibacillus sp. DMB20 TaxID=1642570 RepID=UPI0006279EF3|nr:GNAT family N-acetyltransferase [Paenibacillus sp. DMB20]KKO51362.1 GCN5 family acetyltransferase [Paenibacillus sp. DMB20]
MGFEAIDQFETSKGMFDIGLARIEHREEMLNILQTTAEQMVREGRNQWTPSIFSPALMDEYLREREVFLLRNRGQSVGMFTLQGSDPSYWAERNDTRFAYLHRLAILPPYRGLGLGTKMIAFAELRAADQGKIGLRLDCVSHLEGLNAYYRGLGYRFIAKQGMGSRYVHLYEKLLTVIPT